MPGPAHTQIRSAKPETRNCVRPIAALCLPKDVRARLRDPSRQSGGRRALSPSRGARLAVFAASMSESSFHFGLRCSGWPLRPEALACHRDLWLLNALRIAFFADT